MKGREKMAAKKEVEREVTFEIVERIGVISVNPRGWKKELNLVRWNDKPPKYDLREWDEEHEKMGKGLTFSEEEIKALKELLSKLED
jgi:hypothetical protein